MALVLGKLYCALRTAGVSEDRAREAAEEVVGCGLIRSDTHLLRWMVGALIALMLGVFWMQWQTIARMGDLQAGFSKPESRLAGVGSPPGSRSQQ